MYQLSRALRLGATTLTALTLAPTLATAADPPAAIPQAPVVPLIASSLTLPFTLAGGGEIEVAVLTGDQPTSAATWATTTTLSLAPFLGQRVRVLARAAGESNPANWFDASYTVRSSFSPGVGVLDIPADNPVVAIPGDSNALRGWASGWSEYTPGTNVTDSWKTPQNAIGPVGGAGYTGNTTVVVLGDHGTITMTFPSPIYDGPGDDIAVFENGFRVNGTTAADFVEIGRVRVSSNGTDFVEFDTATTHTAAVGGYAGAPARAYGNIAGRDLNGYGTPFDLTALKNKQEVREGKVDLQRITHVRLVDIVGDGNDRDAFGKPLYDAFPTFGSGGFDLRGIAATHIRGAGIPRPQLTYTGPTSLRVDANVSPGLGGAQDVRLELARGNDTATAVVVGRDEVPGDVASKDVKFDVNGLFPGESYSWRLVAEDEQGELTSTPWAALTKTASTIGTPSAPAASAMQRTVDGIDVTLSVPVTPNTDGVLKVRAEYGTTDGGGNPNLATKKVLSASDVGPASAQVSASVKLLGLAPKTEHWVRWVATRSNGSKLTSTDRIFTTALPGTVTLPSVGRVVTASYAKVPALIRPNTGGDQSVLLAYSTSSGFTESTTLRTAPQTVPGTELEQTLTLKAEGLAAATRYYVRAEVTDRSGPQRNSSSWNFTTPGTLPLVPDPVVSGIEGRAATFTSSVSLGTYGPLRVRYELSEQADGRAPRPLGETVLTVSGAYAATVEDLVPSRDYWVRVVGTPDVETGATVTGNWVAFTAAAPVPTPTPTPTPEPTPSATPAPSATPKPTGTPTPTPTATPIPAIIGIDAQPTPTPAPAAKGQLSKKTVKPGARQRVTVTGLVPGERVTVFYRGRRISKSGAKASAKGRLVVEFNVGRKRGQATLLVKQRASARTLTLTFQVK